MGDGNPHTLQDRITSCDMSAEEWYKNIYEGSPVLYRMINTDGIILDCNRAYVKVLSYLSKQELMALGAKDVLPKPYRLKDLGSMVGKFNPDIK